MAREIGRDIVTVAFVAAGKVTTVNEDDNWVRLRRTRAWRVQVELLERILSVVHILVDDQIRTRCLQRLHQRISPTGDGFVEPGAHLDDCRRNLGRQVRHLGRRRRAQKDREQGGRENPCAASWPHAIAKTRAGTKHLIASCKTHDSPTSPLHAEFVSSIHALLCRDKPRSPRWAPRQLAWKMSAHGSTM